MDSADEIRALRHAVASFAMCIGEVIPPETAQRIHDHMAEIAGGMARNHEASASTHTMKLANAVVQLHKERNQ